MTPVPALFSCGLIGGGQLTIACGNLLLERGHRIAWVQARGAAVADWARQHNIPLCESPADISATGPFDFLFSIVNDLVLSEAYLTLPRLGAINYHNALLPRYAGVFATSWALLNNEKEHGITWHLMEPRVDAGDILIQRTVPIEPHHTAYTLNQACHAAALAALAGLLDQWRQGLYPRTPQDPANRTYYPLQRKPPQAGLIVWPDETASIARLVRALLRGTIDNSFELPRFLYGNSFMIVEAIETAPVFIRSSPGTIVAIDTTGISIATGDGAVRLPQLQYPDGRSIAAVDWARTEGLPAGYQLPVPGHALAHRLEQACTAMARHEDDCLRAWRLAKTDWLPMPATEMNDAQGPLITHPADAATLMAAFVRLIRPWIAGDTVPILFSFPLPADLQELSPFLDPSLPLHFSFTDNETLATLQEKAGTLMQSAMRSGIHSRDLLLRRRVKRPPVHAAFQLCREDDSISHDALIAFQYFPHRHAWRLISHAGTTGGLSENFLQQQTALLLAFLA